MYRGNGCDFLQPTHRPEPRGLRIEHRVFGIERHVWNQRRLRIERRGRSWCRLKRWYKHHPLHLALRVVSAAQRIVQLTKSVERGAVIDPRSMRQANDGPPFCDMVGLGFPASAASDRLRGGVSRPPSARARWSRPMSQGSGPPPFTTASRPNSSGSFAMVAAIVLGLILGHEIAGVSKLQREVDIRHSETVASRTMYARPRYSSNVQDGGKRRADDRVEQR
jgi:hypothetical protein